MPGLLKKDRIVNYITFHNAMVFFQIISLGGIRYVEMGSG
jgi:hypothetical protein